MTVQISDLDLINTLNDNAFIHIKDTDGFDRRMLASTFLQGTPTIRDVKTVDSVVTLRLTEGKYDGQQISLTSYYAGGTTGGGLFKWDAESTAEDDGGVTIQVTGVATGRWVRDAKELELYAFGVVGSGIADDTAAVKRAFASGRNLIDTIGGTYRVVADTVQCYHPFTFKGAGQEKTVFKFETMGGYAGLDAFFVNVADDAPYMSGSAMSGFNIDLANSNGKSGIATRRALVDLGGGVFTNIFSVVRPTFNFESITFTGGTRLGGGAATLMANGFKDYFDVGDSDTPTFKNIIFAGNFDGNLDPTVEPTLSSKETNCFKLGGADDETYGGAVYMPTIINCNAAFVGNAFEIGRRVSNPRCSMSQFGRMGYFINYDKIWLGTSHPGLSEAQFSELNINVAYGGIIIADTDFIDITDVRVTRSDSTFDHNIDWVAYAITNAARQVSLSNVRGYYSNVDYTNQRDVIRMKGVGVLSIDGVFIRHDGAGQFNNAVLLDSCDSFSVNDINCAGDGDATNAVSLVADSPFTPIKGHISAVGRGFVNKLAVNSNVRMDNVYADWFLSHGGIDSSFTTISAADSLTFYAKTDNQVLRRAFAVGAGAYTYDMNLSDLTAAVGDYFKIALQFNSTAGTNPTCRILNHNGDVLFTYTGVSLLKKIIVDVAFNSADWVLISAVEGI